MNILTFKKGDVITRIEPSKGCGDRSYIGDKLTFIGIANGCIYCDRDKEHFISRLTGNTLIDIGLDWWSDGWDLYIDPQSLRTNIETATSKDEINKQIQLAIEKEDYETAELLKKKL